MYKLEYLPTALNDMVEIVNYISAELKNPSAANRLSEEFIKAAEMLTDFPYSNPVYNPLRPLKNEYRKTVVENYIMFYWVDEANKKITIVRVVHGKRDYGKIIK